MRIPAIFSKILLIGALCLGVQAAHANVFIMQGDITTGLTKIFPLEKGTYVLDEAPKASGVVIKRDDDHYTFYASTTDRTGYTFTLYKMPAGDLTLVRLTGLETDGDCRFMFVEITANGQGWTLMDLPTEGYASLPPSLKRLLTLNDEKKTLLLDPAPRAVAYFLRNITQPGFLAGAMSTTKSP